MRPAEALCGLWSECTDCECLRCEHAPTPASDEPFRFVSEAGVPHKHARIRTSAAPDHETAGHDTRYLRLP